MRQRERISTPGRVGFSAHNEPGAFVYDNYSLAEQELRAGLGGRESALACR